MLTLVSTQDSIVFEEPLNLDLKVAPSHKKIVYGSHQEIYRNINIVKAINNSDYPAYLVNSRATKLNYIMKVFPHQSRYSKLYFQNEIRFASLRHPNVLKSLYFENEREATYNGKPVKISYLIIEHATHGDFLDFLIEKQKELDEKLVRTYFRQLINGLEYLHKCGIAHMDLKPENLLISDDYNLKIANLDLAHYKDDALIISNGTRFFRAPEITCNHCKDPQAADIYSAGVLLFTLQSKGRLPQFEEGLINGVDFSNLLYNDVAEFWAQHYRTHEKFNLFFDQDFKDLFIEMTKFEPTDRISIEKIKASKWYNGPIYEGSELKEKMDKILKR